jgi:RimJ/RimL family protein N-acetyltransferase
VNDSTRLDGAKKVHLRTVSETDSQTLFNWRNLPDVRKWSRNSQELDFVAHEDWFKKRIYADAESGPLFIVEVSGLPVGMVRLDLISERTYEISIIVDPDYQRKGIAGSAINLAICELLQIENTFTLNAAIHMKNISSLKLFLKLGFQEFDADSDFLQLRRTFLAEDF